MAFERVKQFKDLEFSYDAPNGMTVKVYTDMPGSTMALRKTLSYPATTGRQTKVMPLDQPAGVYVEGTLYRIEVTSTGVVRLFGGILRARPIGVYLDGGNGEIWQTQELGIGI